MHINYSPISEDLNFKPTCIHTYIIYTCENELVILEQEITYTSSLPICYDL